MGTYGMSKLLLILSLPIVLLTGCDTGESGSDTYEEAYNDLKVEYESLVSSGTSCNCTALEKHLDDCRDSNVDILEALERCIEGN